MAVYKGLYEYIITKRYKVLRKLLLKMKNLAGRSNLGRIIIFGRGGGLKKYYRLIDYKRLIFDIPGIVLKFEYDPNRNIYITLILYKNGVFTYILASNFLRKYMFIYTCYASLYIKIGMNLSLVDIPTGSFIHCIKLNNAVAKYGRTAGSYAILVRKVGIYGLLRLASREELFLLLNNYCILGRLSGHMFHLINYYLAGYNRRCGLKMKVRGVAKNAIDHPHGGSGKKTAGQPSVSRWGIYTKGIKTTTRFFRFTLIRKGFFKHNSKFII